MSGRFFIYAGLVAIAALLGLIIGGGPAALRSSGPTPTLPSPTALEVTPPEATAAPTTSLTSMTVPETPTPDVSTSDSSTTSTQAPTTTAPAVVGPVSTTTTTSSTTTDASTDDANAGEAPETEPAREPADVDIGVANASQVAGAAGRLIERLSDLGYLSTQPFDAVDDPDTVVYHEPDYFEEATTLANDLGLAADDVRPISDAPELLTSREFSIVIVLGTAGGGTIPA